MCDLKDLFFIWLLLTVSGLQIAYVIYYFLERLPHLIGFYLKLFQWTYSHGFDVYSFELRG